MASTTTASIAKATPAPSPAQAAISPTVQAISASTTSDGFLKPGSPRKRRRSLEGAESPAQNLDGQVRDKLGISSPPVPVELTGAAEMAEQKRRKLEHNTENSKASSRQQSANPRHQALNALRGAGSKAFSRPGDAPQTSVSISGTASDVNTLGSAQTSPVSNASFNTVTSAAANPPQVASPTQIGENDVPGEEDVPMSSVPNHVQTASPKSYSYPDPSLSTPQAHGRRDMSFPGAALSDDTKSPANNKKHKCPYCDTEFTRHHNLKSHLLTHSQEKPFMCQQCEMRFRRLHDLKRHAKLHTGERPHVCTICNRKFARGDALARHTKGSGGCAGHRSSVGSFTNEVANENGEMVLDSLMYTGEASQEPGEMEDGEALARQSKNPQYQAAQPNPPGRTSSSYPPVATQSGTYLQASGKHGSSTVPPASTPAAARGSYGQGGNQGSYPPPNAYAQSVSDFSTSISSSTGHHPSGHGPGRGGANQQLRHYAPQSVQGHVPPRPGSTGPAPTANMGLPPPQSVPSNPPSTSAGGHYTQLPPPLPPISTDSRVNGPGSHGHGSSTNGPSYQSAPGSGSTHNSLSSHGQSSGERGTLGIDERDRLWAFINSLKQETTELREKYDSLAKDLDALKRTQKID